MKQAGKVATVFGGTGFLGSQIVKDLAARGVVVKVATRIPEKAYSLKTCGAVGQVVPVACNYTDVYSVIEAIKGSDYVVNCTGIFFERGKRKTFQSSNVDIPAMIARGCADERVSSFVHISALSCSVSDVLYARTKREAEKAVLSNFPEVTIIRPSAIFGKEDSFFNRFAELLQFLPFFPLIGGGKTKFQPVYVGDVAEAVLMSLMCPSNKYEGKTYHLGGPEVFSFKEVYELVFKYTGRSRPLVTMPFALAKICTFLNLMPRPLITPDQVDLLKTDTVVQEGALDFSAFGIHPKSVELVLPEYLGCYRKGGAFSKFKAD